MSKPDPKPRPLPWAEQQASAHPRWMRPFLYINWTMQWTSWALSHWALLDVLDHLGTFSVLIAVIFYFAESGDRLKQKHYQAWQVINTAQGKGGSGGRIEALQELNEDRISLIGIDVGGAFLSGIRLPNAQLQRSDLHEADLRESDLRAAHLTFGNLQGSNFRNANLTGADLASTEMQDTDLNQANLEKANFTNADLSRADLRNTNAKDLNWSGIQSMQLANIYGIKQASPQFLAFATQHGAVSLASDEDWNALLRKAAESR